MSEATALPTEPQPLPYDIFYLDAIFACVKINLFNAGEVSLYGWSKYSITGCKPGTVEYKAQTNPIGLCTSKFLQVYCRLIFNPELCHALGKCPPGGNFRLFRIVLFRES